ncbi:MFS transporter [Paenibacillus polymyxa]|nr:MFS transporter [Paenibacillus polymyxa]MDY8049509.1 MFS transporter [Paenibacillus polymyxa]
MLPGAACAALLGSRIGGWTDRFGSSRVLVISQSLVISGFILLGVSVHLPPWIDALLIIILMIGFNGVLTSSSNLVSTTLRSAELGVGMGIFTLAYLLGGAFGPALVGRLIDLKMPFSVVYFTISLLAILTYLFARKANRSGSYGN